MSDPLRIVVAGITGQLGHGVVEASRDRDVELIPVVRPIRCHDAATRLQRQFPAAPELAARAVAGDVREPFWGLDDATRRALAGTVDVVLNLACETNWSASKRALHATNVLGATAGHALASELGGADGSTTYCWTGSIFAAGALGGTLHEAPFPAAAHRTDYEASKWFGEQLLLRRADAGAPLLIARIGGLVGNSVTGSTAKRNALYLLPDAWARMPRGILPIVPAGRVDSLPRDVVGAAVLDLLAPHNLVRLGDRTDPAIVHVCAGETAPTAAMLFGAIRALRSTVAGSRPTPIRVPEGSVTWMSENLHRAQPLSTRMRNLLIGTRYLSIDRTFDRTNLAEALDGQLPAASAEQLARLLLRLDPPAPRPAPADRALARFEA